MILKFQRKGFENDWTFIDGIIEATKFRREDRSFEAFPKATSALQYRRLGGGMTVPFYDGDEAYLCNDDGKTIERVTL